ncbi:MAG: hypothetical protein LBQ60_02380 [Bacteroidales bacterium]|jgi:hypothetical protein|nr:hypothetical protein [Bacteroidales bacterium]
MKTFKYIIKIVLLSCCTHSKAQVKEGFLPQESSYSVIFEKIDDVKLINKTKLFIAPNGTLLTLTDNTIVPIYLAKDKKEIKDVDFVFDLSKTYPDAQDIMWLNGKGIIIRHGTRIKNITDEGIYDIIMMPNNNFSIYPAKDNLIYIALYGKNNLTSLYLFDVLTKESCKLIDMPFRISDLNGDGDFCFICSGNDIYYLSEKNIKKVVSAPDPVVSLATSEYGLFYGTPNGIYYMDNPNESIYFFKASIKQLLCANNMLYIFTKNGFMSIINNANGYHEMYQRLRNPSAFPINYEEEKMFRIKKTMTIGKDKSTN